MSDKNEVLYHRPDAIARPYQGGYVIDTDTTPLNYWNATEDDAWKVANECIKRGIDPISHEAYQMEVELKIKC